MKNFIVGFFIILFLTGITVTIISCAAGGGTGATTTQQTQSKKTQVKGG